jgi:hypothetical protein
MLSRIDPDEGRGLAGLAKAVRMDAKGQQQSNGAFPYARNRIKQIAFTLQAEVIVDVVADVLEQLLDLAVEPVNVREDATAHGIAGHLGPVLFLYAHGLQ